MIICSMLRSHWNETHKKCWHFLKLPSFETYEESFFPRFYKNVVYYFRSFSHSSSECWSKKPSCYAMKLRPKLLLALNTFLRLSRQTQKVKVRDDSRKDEKVLSWSQWGLSAAHQQVSESLSKVLNNQAKRAKRRKLRRNPFFPSSTTLQSLWKFPSWIWRFCFNHSLKNLLEQSTKLIKFHCFTTKRHIYSNVVWAKKAISLQLL